MGFKCWNGFYEKDNDAFIDKEEYLKMIKSNNPEIREIAKYDVHIGFYFANYASLR